MDGLMNMAKQFAGGNDDENNNQQYQQQGQGFGGQGFGGQGFGGQGFGGQGFGGQGFGGQGFGGQGGPQFNAPGGQNSSGGGFGDILSMFNQGSAVSGAQQELGQHNDPNIQSVLAQGFAQTQAYGSNAVQGGHAVDLNEDGIIDDYERAYARGEAERGNMSSESMGTAAAMSAFKKFSSGGGAQQQSSGGNMQSKLIGMAMAEGIKLFSSSGGKTTNGGGQQDVVNAAGKQIMKMMLKSQMSGSTGTGGGAMGGLMSMASKYM